MGNLFLTKDARIYSGEKKKKKTSSISGAHKTGHLSIKV